MPPFEDINFDILKEGKTKIFRSFLKEEMMNREQITAIMEPVEKPLSFKDKVILGLTMTLVVVVALCSIPMDRENGDVMAGSLHDRTHETHWSLAAGY
ncbi:MAG: hypothetical protein ACK4NC_02990 [Candidatus Gracilibacteria bacterium]